MILALERVSGLSMSLMTRVVGLLLSFLLGFGFGFSPCAACPELMDWVESVIRLAWHGSFELSSQLLDFNKLLDAENVLNALLI